MPVLTGGAYLHISKNAIAKEYLVDNVKNVMAIYGSTSPSYLILQSLDMCNRYLADGYREKLSACIVKIDEIRDRLSQYVLDTDDRLKITVKVPGISGERLAELLRKYGGECEFADKDYMVLMFTPDSDMRGVDCIYRAVDEAVNIADDADDISVKAVYAGTHERRLSIRQAIFADHMMVSVDDAVGMISAAPIVSCPPAIPVVVSGEMITRDDIEIFRQYHMDKVDVVKPNQI